LRRNRSQFTSNSSSWRVAHSIARAKGRGSNPVVKPWEQLTSQQGAVDWYRFWLQGFEDPDTAKAEQYARWRQMREQRQGRASPHS
jgi:hypothetical protein